jgi:hypothetical protein
MEWLHIRVWETTRTHTYNLAWIGLEEKQLGGKEAAVSQNRRAAGFMGSGLWRADL